jgi:hypothetical protein
MNDTKIGTITVRITPCSMARTVISSFVLREIIPSVVSILVAPPGVIAQ